MYRQCQSSHREAKRILTGPELVCSAAVASSRVLPTALSCAASSNPALPRPPHESGTTAELLLRNAPAARQNLPIRKPFFARSTALHHLQHKVRSYDPGSSFPLVRPLCCAPSESSTRSRVAQRDPVPFVHSHRSRSATPEGVGPRQTRRPPAVADSAASVFERPHLHPFPASCSQEAPGQFHGLPTKLVNPPLQRMRSRLNIRNFAG